MTNETWHEAVESMIESEQPAPRVLLEMEVHVHDALIRVRVEDDDGPVSYAEVETERNAPPERCYVTTAKRVVWEYGSHAGDWQRTERWKVSFTDKVRDAMERAARAGLVAAGHG